jgi:hypothetical protein
MSLSDTLDRHRSFVGRYAWWAAGVGLVVGHQHALARYRTADGRGDLDNPLTRAWAEPAGRALRPLLDWADPDVVYLAYGKIWLPVFLGFFLCAVLVRRDRAPHGFESGAWRVVLVGYGWAVLGVAADYWLQWGQGNASLLDITFLATLPALLITLVGSSVLGIALLRNGFQPRISAWLLAGTFALAVLLMSITSQGSAALPVMFAFAIVGRRIATRDIDLLPQPILRRKLA